MKLAVMHTNGTTLLVVQPVSSNPIAASMSISLTYFLGNTYLEFEADRINNSEVTVKRQLKTGN